MNIIGDLKDAATILRLADKIPEYEKVLTTMERIAELQEELGEAKEKIRALQNEIDRMHDDSAVIATLVRQGSILLDSAGIPYCVRCATVDKRLGPLVWSIGSKGFGVTQCTRCKQLFQQPVP